MVNCTASKLAGVGDGEVVAVAGVEHTESIRAATSNLTEKHVSGCVMDVRGRCEGVQRRGSSRVR